MIVAVLAVLAMDVLAHDVVDVALMRDRKVLAAHAVAVTRLVRVAGVKRLARHDVGRPEFVFVEVIAVGMMEVPVVDIVDVIVVDHGEMPARFAVQMLVPIVNVLFHGLLLPLERGTGARCAVLSKTGYSFLRGTAHFRSKRKPL